MILRFINLHNLKHASSPINNTGAGVGGGGVCSQTEGVVIIQNKVQGKVKEEMLESLKG
jgi:hypothetical protein